MLKTILLCFLIVACGFPLAATAELSGVDEVFKSKEQVAYFEVYHIAHESVSYRTAIRLAAVISPSRAKTTFGSVNAIGAP